jgi:hypothetical protein
MLRTGIRWAGTYLTPQQRPSPEWMVSAHAARATSVGPGRQVRVGPRFELPKLQAGLPMRRTAILEYGGQARSDPVDKSGLAGLQS